MKASRPSPHNILIEFPTKKEMNLTMFRISEFFEGDKYLKGRKFGIDEFIDKWTDDEGNFEKLGKDGGYFAYWDGYNVPLDDINEFAKLFINQWTEREHRFIEAIMGVIGIESKYVITCVEGDEMTLLHENAHSKYFRSKEYREACDEIKSQMPEEFVRDVFAGLRSKKYEDDVLDDEMQAYLVAYDPEEWDEMFPSAQPAVRKEFHDKMKKAYDDN